MNTATTPCDCGTSFEEGAICAATHPPVPNPIVKETPLRAYPGWTIRQYQDGMLDATNGSALTGGSKVWGEVIAMVKADQPAKTVAAPTVTSATDEAAVAAAEKANTKVDHTAANLPKIIRFLGTRDGGPCTDGPSAYCPCCGSGGRYTHYFVIDTGETVGAMSGCIKAFPVSPIADTHKRLLDKEQQLRQQYGKDAHLNRHQQAQVAIIASFYAGTITEAEALRQITQKNTEMRYARMQRGTVYGGRS